MIHLVFFDIIGAINSEHSLCASIGMDLVHVQKEAAFMAAVVRILVAIEPLMYREVIALHFRQEHPRSEVVLASKQTLRAEAERISPHLILANEVPLQLKERGVFWVEMP